MSEQLGPYRLGAVLGSGGMGAVYRARDTRTGHGVALKVLRVVDPELLERFRREVELVRKIEHPCLVRVLGVSLLPPRPYAAFELVEGQTLAQRVQRDGPLPPAEAVLVIAALATAVSAVHERGLLHRDIKPANVLLSAGGPKLADFGLVKEVSAQTLTQSGVTLGTPSYLAPEQIGADKTRWGEPTDVYGLAGTLYCALTGKPPFAGKATLDTLRQVLEAPPPSARKCAPAVPAWLDAVCRRGLAKLGGERYPSALALRAALLAGRSAAAPPVRAAWLAGAAAALALVGLALVGAGTRDRAPAPVEVEAPEARVEEVGSDVRAEALAAKRFLAVLEQQIERLVEGGKLEEAEAALTRLLSKAPSRPGPALRMRGVIRLRRGDLEGAAADLERAVALQPDEGKVWTARARLRFHQGNLDAALLDLRRAQELEPEAPTPWQLQGEYQLRARRWALAQEAFRAAAARGADPVRTTLGIAQAQGASGDLTAALETLSAAIERVEQPTALLVARGHLRVGLERHEEAAADFAHALELEPDQPPVALILAALLQRLGRPQEALAWAERVCSVDPGVADAHALRADAFGLLQRYEEALAAAERALALEPGLWRARAVRGRALQALGRSREALPDLDAALAGQPRDVSLRAARVAAWQALGDLPQASPDLDALVELEPERVEWRLLRGRLRYQRGEFAGGLADAGAAGDGLEARVLQGASAAALGDHTQAVAAYDRALELAPDDVDALLGRARGLQALGRLEPALADAERACALASSWEAHSLRGRLLQALGHGAEPDATFNDAVGKRTNSLLRIARAKQRAGQGDLDGALEDCRWALASGVLSDDERAAVEAIVQDLEAQRAR